MFLHYYIVVIVVFPMICLRSFFLFYLMDVEVVDERRSLKLRDAASWIAVLLLLLFPRICCWCWLRYGCCWPCCCPSCCCWWWACLLWMLGCETGRLSCPCLGGGVRPSNEFRTSSRVAETGGEMLSCGDVPPSSLSATDSGPATVLSLSPEASTTHSQGSN